jgi:hypothetical protein
MQSLYDLISEEFPIEEEAFVRHIDELVSIGFIQRVANSATDEVSYTGRPGLQFADFAEFDNPIKQQILSEFVENPATFFILFNTQKGKSKLVQDELMKWSRSDKLIVAFVMLTNDTTLGDQSMNGLTSRMSAENVPTTLFGLSSTSKTSSSVAQICSYIDSYIHYPDENPMPIIAALTNEAQIKKVLEIIQHVCRRCKTSPNLRYGMIWDEADQTYPRVRDKSFHIKTETLCVRKFTLDDTRCLHRNGFVTATEGTLIEAYPECASAHSDKTEQDEQDKQYYRAIHHPDAIVEILSSTLNTKKNNDSFKTTFATKEDYFMDPIIIDGTSIYRKTIINSNASNADMTSLASFLYSKGCHTMTFNQTGLSVRVKGDSETKVFKTKGCSFNEILFYAYKRFGLHTAPLMIMGRKKVDRGLAFHYAPRSYHGIVPKTLEFGKYGPIETDGVEGLIWTDLYLGKVDIKSTAVQKVGRLTGIFAHCPQYTGTITFWMTASTATIVCNHYKLVDATNIQLGCATIEQAMNRAKDTVIPSRFEDTAPAKETEDVRKTIPVIIDNLSADDMIMLNTKKSQARDEHILAIIQRKNIEVYRDIITQGFVLEQVTTPGKKGSMRGYKTHIDDLEKHAVDNTTFEIDIKDKTENIRNVFNCYIDSKKSRFIVMRWRGIQPVVDSTADVPTIIKIKKVKKSKSAIAADV